MVTLALALVVQTSITRVDSVLAAGDVRQALKLATKIVQQRPRDPAAHMLLGRVHYARPVVGRFPALEEFRTAARLAPNDPEPLYWQMQVGFYLRGDDGESVAREALLALFAVTPNYLDAWERFRDVYRNRDIWLRAERAFARHGEQPVALEHRAELLIALEQGARADSLLGIVVAKGAAGVPTYLLRAEANFFAGNPRAGFAWHDSALAHADSDPGDALWDEAWLIASPDEVERHESTPPEERRLFYQRFWGQRDPDLLTPENERLAEHYARRAEVRRTYRLLHPQRTVYHSKLARALQAFDDRREAGDFRAPFPGGGRGRMVPGPSWEFRMMDQFYTSLSSQALQDTAMPLAFRAGVTAQGLVFLRHGKPEQQAICVSDLQHGWQLPSDVTCTSYRDVESWLYWTPAGPMSVRFDKGERFSPSSGEQLHNTFMLLNTDRSTLPAPLVARAWTAMFKSGDLGLTDVYYLARAIQRRSSSGTAVESRCACRGRDCCSRRCRRARMISASTSTRPACWAGFANPWRCRCFRSPTSVCRRWCSRRSSATPRCPIARARCVACPPTCHSTPARRSPRMSRCTAWDSTAAIARAIACSTRSRRSSRRSRGCSAVRDGPSCSSSSAPPTSAPRRSDSRSSPTNFPPDAIA